MGSIRLTELRLEAFKSYEGVHVPLSALTILVGRNGSGKSNALDALEILSRLGQGEDLRDALDGDRYSGAAIRGGSDGCPPRGQNVFALGVTVSDSEEYKLAGFWAELGVRIEVRPALRIIEENLAAKVNDRWITLLRSEESDPHSGDLPAAIFNGRGRKPRKAFRASHLLTSQLPLRLDGDTDAQRAVLNASTTVLAVLAGIFHLDPVPHLMRNYVPAQDAELRRTGENLSAAIARIKSDHHEMFVQLSDIVKQLPENDVRALTVRKGGFGDVMIALKERRGRTSLEIPARQMSDGTLRALAVATALVAGSEGLDLDAVSTSHPRLCLVIEEIENGLHPSQSARILSVIRSTVGRGGSQVVLTTHSPALLNELSGDDHPGVLVVERDRTSGLSTVTPLVQLPTYLRTMAQVRLGDAASDGMLRTTSKDVGFPS